MEVKSGAVPEIVLFKCPGTLVVSGAGEQQVTGKTYAVLLCRLGDQIFKIIGRNGLDETKFEVLLNTVRSYLLVERTAHEITTSDGRKVVLRLDEGDVMIDCFYYCLKGILKHLRKYKKVERSTNQQENHEIGSPKARSTSEVDGDTLQDAGRPPLVQKVSRPLPVPPALKSTLSAPNVPTIPERDPIPKPEHPDPVLQTKKIHPRSSEDLKQPISTKQVKPDVVTGKPAAANGVLPVKLSYDNVIVAPKLLQIKKQSATGTNSTNNTNSNDHDDPPLLIINDQWKCGSCSLWNSIQLKECQMCGRKSDMMEVKRDSKEVVSNEIVYLDLKGSDEGSEIYVPFDPISMPQIPPPKPPRTPQIHDNQNLVSEESKAQNADLTIVGPTAGKKEPVLPMNNNNDDRNTRSRHVGIKVAMTLPTVNNIVEDDAWNCPECTFHNAANSTSCEMCSSLKPTPRDNVNNSTTWTCTICTEKTPVAVRVCSNCSAWICTNCTVHNKPKDKVCLVCCISRVK